MTHLLDKLIEAFYFLFDYYNVFLKSPWFFVKSKKLIFHVTELPSLTITMHTNTRVDLSKSLVEQLFFNYN